VIPSHTDFYMMDFTCNACRHVWSKVFHVKEEVQEHYVECPKCGGYAPLGINMKGRKVDLREALACYAHEAWSGWMKYMFTRGHRIVDGEGWEETFQLNTESYQRWLRQMETHYSDLPEEEKKSDREEADKMIDIFANNLKMESGPLQPMPDYVSATVAHILGDKLDECAEDLGWLISMWTDRSLGALTQDEEERLAKIKAFVKASTKEETSADLLKKVQGGGS